MQHKIILNCPADLEINSYPGVFYQILAHLIRNSLLHGFENTAQGEMEISIWRSRDTLVIAYSDNGKGMTSDILAKSLDPFFTTKRNQGGTGLGLHIVYNLVVHSLRGEMDFTSTPGQGVIFLIRIPLDR